MIEKGFSGELLDYFNQFLDDYEGAYKEAVNDL